MVRIKGKRKRSFAPVQSHRFTDEALDGASVDATVDLTDARRIDELFRAFARRLDATATQFDASSTTSAVVVIDLTATQLVDSKLVACLIAILRRARQLGVRLELRASPNVREWLELCQLRDVM